MEKVDKDPEEAPGRSVLPENQEAQTGVSTWNTEENPNEEGTELSKREEEQERSKRIINLQRELTASVTNIQTAGDAKWLGKRAELEEARRIRQEQEEDDMKASQEKSDEAMRSFLTCNEKRMPQELHEALSSYKQLFDTIIADKKKRLNDLQQEVKKKDDYYVKTLKNNEEEIDLLVERMQEQMRILTEGYREQLGETATVHQQETEVSLAQFKAEYQQEMEELWDKQIAQLMERRDDVENYEEKLHEQMLKDTDLYNQILLEENSSKFKMQRELQEMQAADRHMNLNKKDTISLRSNPVQKDAEGLSIVKPKMHTPSDCKKSRTKKKIFALKQEQQSLKNELMRQQKESAQRKEKLTKEYKRAVDRYERQQKLAKHFAVADARKFREVWITCERERREQMEKILAMDEKICKHLGIPWKRPDLPFMEPPSVIQLQKQALRPDHQEEEGELSMETMKKAMELLCDEAGFLMEDKLLQLLAPLVKEGQLGVLFKSLGIEDEEDVSEVACFLLKYKQEQGVQTEDVCAESSHVAKAAETSTSSNTSTKVIHSSTVLPALRNFLEQRKAKESKPTSVDHEEARHASDYKAYWDSMANIIPEEKLKMWDAAEKIFRKYHAVLKDISALRSRNERLQQRNTELRALVQQAQQKSSSRASGSHKK